MLSLLLFITYPVYVSIFYLSNWPNSSYVPYIRMFFFYIIWNICPFDYTTVEGP